MNYVSVKFQQEYGGFMQDHEYIVYISLKNDKGVLEDHPLRSFGMEIEAEWWLAGYVDAVTNHTEDADKDLVQGMFRISKIGEEQKEK